MKAKNIFLVLIAILFVSSISNGARREAEDFTKSLKVNKGGKLNININSGTIDLTPWEKNEVYVKVKNVDSDEIKNMEVYQEGNNVFVKYSSEWGWGEEIELSVSFPSQYSVDAKTTGGDISVKGNVAGNIDLNTMGGDISLKNVKGKVKINTQGGDLNVGNIEGGLTLSTMGGDIRIGEVIGEMVKANTMGGDIKVAKAMSGIEAVTYGGEIEIKFVGGDYSQLKTMGGSIEVGNANGRVSMQTMGGNLVVQNGSGFIDASSNAGDIVLHNITGSVNAKATSGNITVDISPASGSSSNLNANIGRIEINLLPSAKATIEAEIRVRGNWKFMKDDYKIRSEFEAKSYSADDKERKIKATYEVNGGGGKIYASSNNENITIKKLSK
ncbi:MAG: DUF4097 family beta strand repeat-containing protein [Melioribacteraceae bacterium]|nr:DUF4097 family beta strand repeat-containing protein [Melioribacteraceae bacterium]